MKPDAIVVFSAGIMPLENGGWRTTTYEERDGFGTMGGRDRVEAAAVLATRYPDAYVVTTCKRMDGEPPTLASVYSDELVELGVAPERIVKEEVSVNTGTSVTQVLRIAHERGWKHLLFVSSGFQIPRIVAFFEHDPGRVGVTVEAIASEPVLSKDDETFAKKFAAVEASAPYQERLAAEQRGIDAIKSGKYLPAPIEEKKERPS